MVWLEAWDHVEQRRDRTIINNVDTYLYPIASGTTAASLPQPPDRGPPSFDPEVPNPYISLATRHHRDRFTAFAHRWLFFDARRRNCASSVARWHFLDRFGHGVVLDYIGAEAFERKMVEVIRVDDRQCGHYFEAFFSKKPRCSSPPARACRGRTAPLRRQYRTPPPSGPLPTANTALQNALLPHRLTRSGPSCPHCPALPPQQPASEVTIQLQMAANGEEPV